MFFLLFSIVRFYFYSKVWLLNFLVSQCTLRDITQQHTKRMPESVVEMNDTYNNKYINKYLFIIIYFIKSIK